MPNATTIEWSQDPSNPDNRRLCRKCGDVKTHIYQPKRENGTFVEKRYSYVDEKGRRWKAGACPDCENARAAKYRAPAKIRQAMQNTKDIVPPFLQVRKVDPPSTSSEP